jgi:hypothetical protein
MGQKVRYHHHNADVWVDEDLQGKHRDHCLCYGCDRFKPGTDNHCEIAGELYQLVVKHNLVTPVYECPKYVPASVGGL